MKHVLSWALASLVLLACQEDAQTRASAVASRMATGLNFTVREVSCGPAVAPGRFPCEVTVVLDSVMSKATVECGATLAHGCVETTVPAVLGAAWKGTPRVSVGAGKLTEGGK